MSFPQFSSFPPEIHALILDSCPANDLVCLRLTCKYLYNFSAAPKQRISLEGTDTGPLCQCEDVGKDWSSLWTHRRDCHKISFEAVRIRKQSQGFSAPVAMKKCRTRYAADHCECFTRRNRLHFRLKSWMPKQMNYCGRCTKFTVRKRNHNGRCYHGHAKPRKCEPKFWTHTSRNGAFGRKIWKKWFNNKAMNRLEARLQTHHEANDRKGSSRYSLRCLEAKAIDSRVVRDNKSIPMYGDSYYQ